MVGLAWEPLKNDGFVNSPKTVMPDLIPAEVGIFDRHPELIEISCIWLQFKSQFFRLKWSLRRPAAVLDSGCSLSRTRCGAGMTKKIDLLLFTSSLKIGTLKK